LYSINAVAIYITTFHEGNEKKKDDSEKKNKMHIMFWLENLKVDTARETWT
jgi:hypothetical protein